MGAWGHGSFENDDTSDWVYQLEESTDLSPVHAALAAVADERVPYLEAPECCAAIAAAEVVAALAGKPGNSLPDTIADWCRGKGGVEDDVREQAVRAIDTILAKSELKELWEETDDFDAWTQVVNELRERLV